MPGSLSDLGRLLVGLGLLLVVVGALLVLAGGPGGKLSWLGRLPGDIHVQRGNWSFYFPLTTSILVSLVLTLLFALWSRR
jgi:membrane protein implicated in regulation of membrane protease activity